MTGKTFVDTSVLIYAHDRDAREKHEAAKNVLRELWSERTGALSLQVLQEFFVSATSKIPSPLPREMARLIVNSYAIWCTEITTVELESAFHIEDEAKVAFWDALILAAALKSGATRILSEDLRPDLTIAGIKIENPFA